MRKFRRRGGLPPNWGWILALGVVGAALYSADVFGVRSKIVDPVISGTIGKVA